MKLQERIKTLEEKGWYMIEPGTNCIEEIEKLKELGYDCFFELGDRRVVWHDCCEKKIMKNKKIFTFKYLLDKGLAVVIKVKDMEFKLVYDKLQGTENKKYYILIKDNGHTSYDIIGEETDYDEAELCFITEITRYDDLSYEEE